MTPRSLMGFLIALFLSIPGFARAAEDWKEFVTKAQTFYLEKVEYQRLADARPPIGPTDLFAGRDKAPGKVATLERNANGEWIVNLTARNNGRYLVAGQAGGTPKKPAGDAPPGVNPEIWSVVAHSGIEAGPNKEKWVYIANSLQTLATTNPEQYALLMGAKGFAPVDNVIKEIEKYKLEGKTPAAAAKALIDGNVINTNVRVGRTTVAPVDGSRVAGDEERTKSALGDALARLIAAIGENKAFGTADPKLTVQQSIADRFTDFMFGKAAQQSYIAQSFEAAATFEAEKAKVAEAMRAKVAALAGTEEGKRQLAVLYYVMGDARAAGAQWLGEIPELAEIRQPLKLREQLDSRMTIFSRAGGTRENPNEIGVSPFNGSEPDRWIESFINEGAARAQGIFTNRHLTKEDIDREITGREEDPTLRVGGGTRRPGRRGGPLNDSPVRGFGFDDMYVKGAVTGPMWVPGTDPKEYRRISMRIYTKMNPDGTKTEELGIFDITDAPGGGMPGAGFGRRFPISKKGEQVFRLDDRREDSIKYKLTIGDGGTILFDLPDGNEEGPIDSSINELYSLRAEHAAQEGQVRTINGERFRVIAQGGKNGSLLYFRADENGDLAGGNSPALMADVSERGPSGFTQRMKGDRPLGFVGKNSEGKPEHYNLVWNEDAGYFEPKAGPPPAPPTTTPGDTATTPPTTSTPTTPGTTTPTTTTSAGAVIGNGSESVAEAGFSKRCVPERVGFATMKPMKYGDWNIFVAEGSGVGWALCLNEDKFIQFAGVPRRIAWDNTLKTLVVETMAIKSSPGLRYLQFAKTAEEKNKTEPGHRVELRGQAQSDITTSGDSPSPRYVVLELKKGDAVLQKEQGEVAGRFIYYIPKEHLENTEMDKRMGTGDNRTGPVSGFARWELTMKVDSPAHLEWLKIYMHGASEAQGKEWASAAMTNWMSDAKLYPYARFKQEIVDYAGFEAATTTARPKEATLTVHPELRKEMADLAEGSTIAASWNDTLGHTLKLEGGQAVRK